MCARSRARSHFAQNLLMNNTYEINKQTITDRFQNRTGWMMMMMRWAKESRKKHSSRRKNNNKTREKSICRISSEKEKQENEEEKNQFYIFNLQSHFFLRLVIFCFFFFFCSFAGAFVIFCVSISGCFRTFLLSCFYLAFWNSDESIVIWYESKEEGKKCWKLWLLTRDHLLRSIADTETMRDKNKCVRAIASNIKN